MSDNRWLLPEGIEEVLPASAQRLELLRRELLDLYRSWGYELVMPPLIEYLETLLAGADSDLELQTFKLTDQLSGRMMGVRADMTPQVARIEAHVLKRSVPTRLCYMGTVLRTRPLELGGSRSPLQVGAELYGHSGPESDVEIIALMLASIEAAGVKDVLLDIGHVGVFRGLVKEAGLNTVQEADLFDQLRRKSVSEVSNTLAKLEIPTDIKDCLAALPDLNGDIEALDTIIQPLQAGGELVADALASLKVITSLLVKRLPDLKIHFDLAELSAYHYHTGVVFSVYSTGRGQAIAQGGRYDNIGQDVGVSRPATGFSADLKQWVRLSGAIAADDQPAILAPAQDDAALQLKIVELREAGERVIQTLPNHDSDAKDMGCDRQLVKQSGGWQVEAL